MFHSFKSLTINVLSRKMKHETKTAVVKNCKGFTTVVPVFG